MTSTEPKKKAALAFIERLDRRFLCVWNLRYNGWALPGGKVEDGETPLHALGRELWEETGLELISADIVFEGPHDLAPQGEENSGRIVCLFTALTIGTPREMEPGGKVAWLTREEFMATSPFAAFYRNIFTEVLP